MDILVTGATGFIGRHLVERLKKEGHRVFCLVREESKEKAKELKEVNVVYGDITKKETLKRNLKSYDAVFHLAAAFGKLMRREDYFKVNVYGTKNLLEVCKEKNVGRFIHYSACGVYGSSKKVIDETSPYNPGNPYEESKMEGEKIVIFFMNRLPIVILQPAVVFGPGDTYNIFKLFKGIKEGKFVIIGDGENKLHFVYIKNLVDASLLALKSKRAIGERFLIADEKALRVRELAFFIAKQLNVSHSFLSIPKWLALIIAYFEEKRAKITMSQPLITREGVKFLSENHEYCILKAKKILGYKPKYTTYQGIVETIKWYRERGLL